MAGARLRAAAGALNAAARNRKPASAPSAPVYPVSSPPAPPSDPLAPAGFSPAPGSSASSRAPRPPAPAVSARLAAVQSPIIPIVMDLYRRHPGAVSLGQGVVGYGPPPGVAARVARFCETPAHHLYQPDEGIPALRAAIRRKLAHENGIDLAAREVMVTAGANMGFLNALLAITDPGDEVILPRPYFFNHEMAIRMAGAAPRVVPCRPDHQLDVDAITAATGPRTRAVATTSPNNPSGATYPEADLRAVNALCRERGLYHLHDEAYEYFVHDGAAHFSPGAIPGSESHTIEFWSLSKAYGFASWRVGYMAFPAALMETLLKVQDTNVICAPAISQHAALACLEAGAGYCRPRIEGFAPNRALLLDTLAGLGGRVEAPPANGAFYVFARVGRGRNDLDDMAVVRELIVEHGVAVVPGSAFGAGEGCSLRLSYAAVDRDTMEVGARRLAEGLRAITDRRERK